MSEQKIFEVKNLYNIFNHLANNCLGNFLDRPAVQSTISESTRGVNNNSCDNFHCDDNDQAKDNNNDYLHAFGDDYLQVINVGCKNVQDKSVCRDQSSTSVSGNDSDYLQAVDNSYNSLQLTENNRNDNDYLQAVDNSYNSLQLTENNRHQSNYDPLKIKTHTLLMVIC